MKIRLLGKNLEDIRPLLDRHGLQEVVSGAEAVITYGGDGALLGAARDFPDLPILAIRDAATAPTCPLHEAGTVLDRFVSGALKQSILYKLCAESPNGTLYGINDLFLHNINRTSSLRFQVKIDGEIYAQEVRGDGVCLSTVHGSSAYYRSITGGMFKVGMGLAFSHANADIDHLILDTASVVELTIIRGPGMVIADNDPEHLQLENGESVIFRMSEKFVTIYGLEGFMCGACRKIRHGM